MTDAELHCRHLHPDYEYCLTELLTVYPPDQRDGWTENVHCGPGGKEWLGRHEGIHWYRRKDQVAQRDFKTRYHPASVGDLFTYYGHTRHEF